MDGDAMAAILETLRGGEWTSADLDRMPDGWKVEILDGTLIVNAQPMPRHQLVAHRLARVIEDALHPDHQPLTEIMLDLGTARFAPDISVGLSSRIDWEAQEQRPDTIALVVEVDSPSTRAMDRTIKAERYAEAGIPGYWRVELDPEIRVVAYALRGDAYTEVGSWTAGQTVTIDHPARVSFDPATLLP